MIGSEKVFELVVFLGSDLVVLFHNSPTIAKKDLLRIFTIHRHGSASVSYFFNFALGKWELGGSVPPGLGLTWSRGLGSVLGWAVALSTKRSMEKFQK
jgi:hypothetical protein